MEKSNNNRLNESQQQRFSEICEILGIKQSRIPNEVTIEASKKKAYLTVDSRHTSLIQHETTVIQDLETLLRITNTHQADAKEQLTGQFSVPKPWPEKKALNDLSGHEIDNLEKAMKIIISGHGDMVPTYHKAIEAHFFPLTVLTYTAQNITIKSGQTKVIKGNGHNPVVVNYGTLTLEEGGQIICDTNVTMNVQNFEKVPASS